MGNTIPISCDHSFNWEEINNSSGSILPGREGHSCVFYNDCLYFFGGIQDCSADNNDSGDDEEEKWPTSCMNDLYKYNIKENEWQTISCSGDIPSPRSGCVSCVIDDQLFVYGGLDPLYGWMTDGFLFDFGTKIWKKINFTGDMPQPRDKSSCITLDNSKIILFGGFGPQQIELEEGEEDTATFGWFNDTFIFDLKDNNRWIKLDCSGEFPTPRAAFGMALIKRPEQIPIEIENKENEEKLPPSFTEGNDEKSFLYIMGGRDNKGLRTNDTFALNIESKVWKKISSRGTAPVGRSFHTCIAIKDKLFVFGGADSAHQVLNDIHIMDTRAESQHAWIQPKYVTKDLSKQPSPRAFHAAVLAEMEDNLYVYIHGGAGEMDITTGEHLNFCHNIWRINLASLSSYRAPTLEQVKQMKEEQENNKKE